MGVSFLGTRAGTSADASLAAGRFGIFYAPGKGLVSYAERSRKRPNDAENQGLMTERFHQPLIAAIYRDLPILAVSKRLWFCVAVALQVLCDGCVTWCAGALPLNVPPRCRLLCRLRWKNSSTPLGEGRPGQKSRFCGAKPCAFSAPKNCHLPGGFRRVLPYKCHREGLFVGSSPSYRPSRRVTPRS
jgi:hypothetical protein